MSMTRFAAVLIAMLVAAAPMPSGAKGLDGADVWNSAEIDWKDMRTGVREATASGKPVLMLMQATWCSACNKYRSVFQDKDVVAASRNLVMILVDIDKEPDVNSGFAPDGTYVPRTIFLDATGEIRGDLKGSDPQYPHSLKVSDPSELLSLMRKATEGNGAAPAPDRRADADH